MNKEYIAPQSKLLYCQGAQNQVEASRRKSGDLVSSYRLMSGRNEMSNNSLVMVDRECI